MCGFQPDQKHGGQRHADASPRLRAARLAAVHNQTGHRRVCPRPGRGRAGAGPGPGRGRCSCYSSPCTWRPGCGRPATTTCSCSGRAFTLATAGRDYRRRPNASLWHRWPGHAPHILAMSGSYVVLLAAGRARQSASRAGPPGSRHTAIGCTWAPLPPGQRGRAAGTPRAPEGDSSARRMLGAARRQGWRAFASVRMVRQIMPCLRTCVQRTWDIRARDLEHRRAEQCAASST